MKSERILASTISDHIPAIPEELLIPIGALVRSSVRLRIAFCSLAGGAPVEELLDGFSYQLDLANRVVNTWITHLEIDEEIGGLRLGFRLIRRH
jgi:hypothetical protein